MLNHTEMERGEVQGRVADAYAFAEVSRIPLNGHIYISQEDFTDRCRTEGTGTV